MSRPTQRRGVDAELAIPSGAPRQSRRSATSADRHRRRCAWLRRQHGGPDAAKNDRSHKQERARMDHANEIRSLIVRQKIGVDAQDETANRACWAPNATLQVSVNGGEPRTAEGLEDVMAFARNARVTDAHVPRAAPLVHFSGPAEIVFQANDRALVNSTCLYLAPGEGQMVIRGYGLYRDEVILEDGAWKLLTRELRMTLPE